MKATLTPTQWKIIFLSSLGGSLEFYDFIIFAIFAVPIGKTFFPSSNPLTSTLYAFALFAIGYLARPLGGIVMSHFGDRYGRKNVFIISMMIMAVSTFFMAILPGYSSLGIIATLLFICLRLCQGVAIGGEIPGAITFVKEHVYHHPGFACGVVFLFINLGIFLADLAYAILNDLTTAQYAWRIAFFIGGFLAILSYFLRKTLQESQVFKSIAVPHAWPFLHLLKHHLSSFIQGFFIVAYQAMLISLLYLYIPSFMKLHHYTHIQISWISSSNLAIFSLSCAFWGWLSDYTKAHRLMFICILLLMPLVIWFYHSIIFHQHLMLSYALLSIVASMYTGSFSAYLAEMFPVSVRFSGVGFSYNLGFALFGGLTPLLASYFIKLFTNAMMPAYLFIFLSLFSLAGIAWHIVKS